MPINTIAFTSNIEVKIAEDFKKIAKNMDKKPAKIIREFITALVENRVKITAKNDDTEFHRNLYN